VLAQCPVDCAERSGLADFQGILGIDSFGLRCFLHTLPLWGIMGVHLMRISFRRITFSRITFACIPLGGVGLYPFGTTPLHPFGSAPLANGYRGILLGEVPGWIGRRQPGGNLREAIDRSATYATLPGDEPLRHEKAQGRSNGFRMQMAHTGRRGNPERGGAVRVVRPAGDMHIHTHLSRVKAVVIQAGVDERGAGIAPALSLRRRRWYVVLGGFVVRGQVVAGCAGCAGNGIRKNRRWR
jgi:hypothetical protein